MSDRGIEQLIAEALGGARVHPADDPAREAPPRDPVIPYNPFELRFTEYVIDGFIAVGSLIIAGTHGIGKTTCIVPLAAAVAHLAPEEWGLRPELRRRVVWITEAVDQTERVLFSVLRSMKNPPALEDVRYWFEIRRAHRLGINDRAAELERIEREYSRVLDLDDDGREFVVKPLVVLDTTSATVELESENDNAEVSRALAAMRIAAPTMPRWLIAHMPKNIERKDASTARGASAWEADTDGSAYLLREGAEGPRVLVLGKRRFTPEFDELTFGSQGGDKNVSTPWGSLQAVRYVHGEPNISHTATRKQQAEQRKQQESESRQQAAEAQTMRAVAEVINDRFTRGLVTGVRALRSGVKAKAADVDKALQRLVDDGTAVKFDLPKDVRDAPSQRQGIIPAGSDPNVLIAVVRARIPSCPESGANKRPASSRQPLPGG